MKAIVIMISIIAVFVAAMILFRPSESSTSTQLTTEEIQASISQTTQFLELMAYKQGFYFRKTNGQYTHSLLDLKNNGLFDEEGEELYLKISMAFVDGTDKKIRPYQGFQFNFLKSKTNQEYAILGFSKQINKLFYLDQNMIIYTNDNVTIKDDILQGEAVDLSKWKMHFDINRQHTLRDVCENIIKVSKLQEEHRKEKLVYATDMVELYRFKQSVDIELMMAFTGENHPVMPYDTYYYKFLKTDDRETFMLFAYPEKIDEQSPVFLIGENQQLLTNVKKLDPKKIRHMSQIDLSDWKVVNLK